MLACFDRDGRFLGQQAHLASVKLRLAARVISHDVLFTVDEGTRQAGQSGKSIEVEFQASNSLLQQGEKAKHDGGGGKRGSKPFYGNSTCFSQNTLAASLESNSEEEEQCQQEHDWLIIQASHSEVSEE